MNTHLSKPILAALLCIFFSLTFSEKLFAEDLFRSLTTSEKHELSANIFSRCIFVYKEQRFNKLSHEIIKNICDCTAREMVSLLVPYDILEEMRKNKDVVIDPTTNLRKIQNYSGEKCTQKFLKK